MASFSSRASRREVLTELSAAYHALSNEDNQQYAATPGLNWNSGHSAPGASRRQGPCAAGGAARDDGGPEDGVLAKDGAEEGRRPKLDDALSDMFLRAARTVLDGEGLKRAWARAEDKAILDAVRAHSRTHVGAATSSCRLMGQTAGGDHDQVFDVCRVDARKPVITFRESFEAIKNGAFNCMNGQTTNDSAQKWKKKHVMRMHNRGQPLGKVSTQAKICHAAEVCLCNGRRSAGHVASPQGASAHES